MQLDAGRFNPNITMTEWQDLVPGNLVQVAFNRYEAVMLTSTGQGTWIVYLADSSFLALQSATAAVPVLTSLADLNA